MFWELAKEQGRPEPRAQCQRLPELRAQGQRRNQNWLWTVLKHICGPKSALACFLIAGTSLSVYIFYVSLPQQQKYEDPGPYHVAYPRQYRFILDHPEKCRQHKPFVTVIVPTALQNVKKRNAIRSTWGNDDLVKDRTVLVLFLLGLPSGNDSKAQQRRIYEENLQHQDLLQSTFIDSYRNLTIKTMVMLEWLKDRCPQAFFAVKVDDDMLLNIKDLVRMLLNPDTPHSNYNTGRVWHNNVVIRDPDSKFYIPPEVYPNAVYPPYPLGMCYIMSMDLPEKILQVSKEIKPIFIEDAYIALCLERLNIAPTEPPHIDQFVVHPPPQYDRCYYSTLIAVITYNPDELVSYWTDLHKPGPPC
ncbi:beta-1,3-galactosyltransferase 2-like [Astyanax mexicanus]|uniref:beta-1,3-galactosyltransferase 2-like n=1 Tax=Astyanax mexicanus TaxID=7994 RepID=UPI0020CA9EE7|nr:beta-1,3-galactosyltransferase 2-like [Astyanax mexicanus]